MRRLWNWLEDHPLTHILSQYASFAGIVGGVFLYGNNHYYWGLGILVPSIIVAFINFLAPGDWI
jgi:hypothetical protein